MRIAPIPRMQSGNDATRYDHSRFRFRISRRYSARIIGVLTVLMLFLPTLAQEIGTREPREIQYQIMEPSVRSPMVESGQDWINARESGSGSGKPNQFGRSLVMGVSAAMDPEVLLSGSELRVQRRLAPELIIAEGPNPWTVLREIKLLLQEPAVLVAVPIMKRPFSQTSAYAPKPNDPYFFRQWNLENRDGRSGSKLGVDLNIRSAWAMSKGHGITVAVADDGIDFAHPDLGPSLNGSPHFNFVTRSADGGHANVTQAHGTAVAGLVSTTDNNKTGMAGTAPEAKLASWVIWDEAGSLISTEVAMNMFQYESNRVSVQNHSWSNGERGQLDESVVERIGISNAVHFGRNGLGVILVRSAGNLREDLQNSNDDGFSADPAMIAVGAVRFDGSPASYSRPGANMLVAAPSGDFVSGTQSLFTTDRVGTVGYNNTFFADDLGDYAFDGSGFSGTSGSAPQVAGLAAIALSCNPLLTYRDFQHILVLSSRQPGNSDPDVKTNGAGLLVSHNTGFGVPDAGVMVRLAKTWSNRPPQIQATRLVIEDVPIPDDSLRVEVSGTALPPELQVLRAAPTSGAFPDDATLELPLLDVGQATSPVFQDLHGKAALIQRGGNTFTEKMRFVTEAGAAFAIIWNNQGVDVRERAQDDSGSIPSASISQNDGNTLKNLLAAGKPIRVKLAATPATYTVTIPDTLLCEQIVATVDVDHPRRGDLRIALVSPSGTRSILQNFNYDVSPGPVEWPYMTTHCFLEPGAGTWRLEVTDGSQRFSGKLKSLKLTILGTPILDTDRDGLDDNFEMRHFGNLAQGAKDDPDHDGSNNAREQLLGTDPTQPEQKLTLDLAEWDAGIWRLSWPAAGGEKFEVLAAHDVAGPFESIARTTGQFPETSVFLKQTSIERLFLRLHQVAP